MDLWVGRPILTVITSHSDAVGAGDREMRVLPPARPRSAIVANTPKTPTTRADYDSQVMQYSLEALERSYRLLKETDALLTSKHLPVRGAISDQEPDEHSERSRT